MTRDERPAPDVDATWEAFARRLDQLAVNGQIDWTAYGHALAEHRPLIEAAIRASGSPTDAARRFTVDSYDERRREVREMVDEADRNADEGTADPDSLADALMEIAEGWRPRAASGSPEPVLDVERLAHKAAEIGFTYGALGRDFEYALKNVNDMLAGSEEREP